MADTMLERMARAIEPLIPDSCYQKDHAEAVAVEVARAALEAIREPSEAMVRAFWLAPAVNGPDEPPGLPTPRGGTPLESEWFGTGEQFSDAYRAMIDAILSETTNG